MSRIQAYRQNWVASGATSTIAAGPGAIHTIIATSSSATPLTLILYDHTTAGSQTLLALYLSAAAPILFNLKDIGPIRFTTGLTITCPAGVTCFVVTEQ